MRRGSDSIRLDSDPSWVESRPSWVGSDSIGRERRSCEVRCGLERAYRGRWGYHSSTRPSRDALDHAFRIGPAHLGRLQREYFEGIGDRARFW